MKQEVVENPSEIGSDGDEDAGLDPTLNGNMARNPSIEITCLFCFNSILRRIQPDLEEKEEEKDKRKVRLINLCDDLHLNKDEIPDLCLNEMFPFCNTCHEKVDNLWEYKQKIEQLQTMVKHLETSRIITVNEIQRKVVDRVLLESTMKKQEDPLVVEAEARKFTRLKDMILEAYRKGLLANISQQHGRFPEAHPVDGGLGVATPICSTTIAKKEVQGSGSRPILVAAKKKNRRSSPTLMSAPQAADENKPGHSSAVRKRATDAAPGPSSVPATVSTASKNKSSTKRSILKESLPSTSKKRAVSPVGGCGVKRKRVAFTPKSNLLPTVLLRKIDAELLMNINKKSAAAAQAERNSSEEESDDESMFIVAEQKERQLFKGVKIFRCKNAANEESLECPTCSFTIPITKKCDKGNTPYLKMKGHIDYIHKDQAGEADKRKFNSPPTIFECDFCAKIFPTQESFCEHQNLYPLHKVPSQECDVCGCPLKLNHADFFRHRFSHKNDEERRTALKAREEGAHPSFLEKTDENQAFSKKYPKLSQLSNPGNPAGLVAGDLKCHICRRSFTMNESLTLHLKSHDRLSKKSMKKVSVPSPPSSLADLEVLKVHRMRKKPVKYGNPSVKQVKVHANVGPPPIVKREVEDGHLDTDET